MRERGERDLARVRETPTTDFREREREGRSSGSWKPVKKLKVAGKLKRVAGGEGIESYGVAGVVAR